MMLTWCCIDLIFSAQLLKTRMQTSRVVWITFRVGAGGRSGLCISGLIHERDLGGLNDGNSCIKKRFFVGPLAWKP